jgi:hypothetical protein
MRFQIAEGISLLGSMSEFALLFSLTPNRRETLAPHTTHRHRAPTATVGSATSPCLCRQSPPHSPHSPAKSLTNSRSQQVDADQTSDASHRTHLQLFWMTSQYRETANISTEVSMLDQIPAVLLIWFTCALLKWMSRTVTGLLVLKTGEIQCIYEFITA